MSKKKISRLVFDLEGNGLLYDINTIHCICAKDINTNQVFKFRPNQIEDGLKLLSSYDIIVGHNICGFDIPAIQKLYPHFTYNKVRDTLCMSRLFNPERFGGHSLDSYGKMFGRLKPVHEDWSVFSEEMLHRCSEDVEINCMLYSYLVERYCGNWKWIESLEIEQEFLLYRAYQELEGVDIDENLAYETLDKLDKEIEELDRIILSQVPKRVVPVGTNHEKGCLPFKKNGEYTAATLTWIEDINGKIL